MTATRILVTGSRRYHLASIVRNALQPYRGRGLTLVHGRAPGLDTLAATIWHSWGEASDPHPADWTRYGSNAGPIRNQEMINLGGYLACLAFPLPGSRGTWDCVHRATQAGIPVHYPEETST